MPEAAARGVGCAHVRERGERERRGEREGEREREREREREKKCEGEIWNAQIKSLP